MEEKNAIKYIYDRHMRTLLPLFYNNNNTIISQVPWNLIGCRRFRFVTIHSINSVKEDKEVREFKRGALFLTHTNMYSPDSSLFLTLRAAVYYSRINGYRHGLILKVYFSLSLFGSP